MENIDREPEDKPVTQVPAPARKEIPVPPNKFDVRRVGNEVALGKLRHKIPAEDAVNLAAWLISAAPVGGVLELIDMVEAIEKAR